MVSAHYVIMTLPAAGYIGMVFMCLALIFGLVMLVLCTNEDWRNRLRATLASYHVRSYSGTVGKASMRTTSASNMRSAWRTSRSSLTHASQLVTDAHAYSSVHKHSRPSSIKYDYRRQHKNGHTTSQLTSYTDTPPSSNTSHSRQLDISVSSEKQHGYPKSILRNSTRNSALTSGYNTSTSGTSDKPRTSKTVHMDEQTCRLHIHD